MIKNNNQLIIRKLSFNSIKSYKSRSVLTVFAIILTCILITSVLTVSGSLIKSFEYTKAMQVGTLSHGGFKRIEPSEVQRIIEHPSIESYSLSVILGRLEDEVYNRRRVEVRTMDLNALENGFLMPMMGRLPEAYHEIMVDCGWLDIYGLPYELNQEIHVTLNIGNDLITETFKIVGIGSKNVYAPSSFFIMSDVFKNDFVTDHIGEEMLGAVDIGITFDSKWHIEEKLMTILNDVGMTHLLEQIGINWAYVSDASNYQVKDVVVFISFILMLMGSGYLIIYNIYLISVTKDINYYGLLKTIGATSQQIRKIVLLQGVWLYFIGLPIGLLLGYAIGLWLVPYVMSNMNTDVILTSGHIGIFILAAALTLLTVLISCLSPARYAGRVSEIEAIRKVEYSYIRKPRRRKVGNKIYRMAWQNLFRVRKKALLVILSIILSLSIFTGVFMRIAGFDQNEFLKQMIGTDYLIASSSYFSYNYDGEGLSSELLKASEGEVHPLYFLDKDITLSKEHQQALLDDIESVDTSNYGENRLREGILEIDLFGIDPFILEVLKSHVCEGEISDILNPNDIIIENRYFTNKGFIPVKVQIGDELNIEGSFYRIVAMVENLPQYLYDQSFSQYGIHGFAVHQEGALMSVMVNGSLNEVLIQKKYPNVVVKSRDDYIEDMKQFMLTLKIVGFTLSGILSLIGILNFINMMATSIIIRKREFAVLQSIGMTKSQLKRMLIYEGGYIMGIVSVVTGLISIALNLMMTTFKLQLHIPVFVVMMILMIFVMFIPVLVYKSIEKSSIVERIRAVS